MIICRAPKEEVKIFFLIKEKYFKRRSGDPQKMKTGMLLENISLLHKDNNIGGAIT